MEGYSTCASRAVGPHAVEYTVVYPPSVGRDTLYHTLCGASTEGVVAYTPRGVYSVSSYVAMATGTLIPIGIEGVQGVQQAVEALHS